ncbi:MAG: putative nitrate transporter NarT [Calditrichaeota bacterium]|nr:putative nitrate transporter NarT [Calditrichota bacterium]
MENATLKGTPNQGLLGATVGFFAGFAAVSLFGPTANQFEEILGLTPVMVGFLVAMPSLSGSLLRIPFSAWVDTTGGRKPFLVLLILSIAGMLGLFFVVRFVDAGAAGPLLYPLLLLLGLLCGCGIATFSVGISQVSYWFPQANQGRALGTYAGLGNLAPGILSFLLPVGLETLGLGGSYFLWVLFLSAGTIAYAFLGKNAWFFQFRKQGASYEESIELSRAHGQQLFPRGRLTESLKESAKIPGTWALVVVYFTTFGGFIALTAWLPTYWSKFHGVSLVAAGTMTAVYSILTSAIRVGGGFVADRIGGRKTAILSLTLTGVGAVLLTLSHVIWLSAVGQVLMGIGMGVANAAVFKLVPQVVPDAVGGAAGWVGGLGAFGGFSIPPAMGLFVRFFDLGGYAFGFVIFIFLALLSITLLKVVLNHADEPAGEALADVQTEEAGA